MLGEKLWETENIVFLSLACHRVMQHGRYINGLHVRIRQHVMQPLPFQEGLSMLLPRKLLLDILLV